MSVALVTGVSGFLGQYLTTALRAEPNTRVVGTDLYKQSADMVLDEFVELDISDDNAVSSLIHRLSPDRIFHLAGIMGDDRERAYRVNAVGTVTVLEAARGHSPDAAVLVVGSAAEYGPAPLGSLPFAEDAQCFPRDAYGASKLAATRAAQSFSQQYGMRIVVVRPFNIVGAGMRDSLVVGALARRAAKAIRDGKEQITVGNLDAQRDFIAVTDVAAGCVAAISGGKSGQIYNICSGRATAVRWIAEQMVLLTGRDLRLEVDPALDRGADASVGSPDRARNDFGFVASTPLEQPLREIWDSVMRRGGACASAS